MLLTVARLIQLLSGRQALLPLAHIGVQTWDYFFKESNVLPFIFIRDLSSLKHTEYLCISQTGSTLYVQCVYFYIGVGLPCKTIGPTLSMVFESDISVSLP